MSEQEAPQLSIDENLRQERQKVFLWTIDHLNNPLALPEIDAEDYDDWSNNVDNNPNCVISASSEAALIMYETILSAFYARNTDVSYEAGQKIAKQKARAIMRHESEHVARYLQVAGENLIDDETIKGTHYCMSIFRDKDSQTIALIPYIIYPSKDVTNKNRVYISQVEGPSQFDRDLILKYSN